MIPPENPGDWVAGYWIETFHGRRVDPVNPDPDQIAIDDIAHALARQCRFTGHSRDFYTVAQHSVLVSWRCPLECALEGLLHDAGEAYLADLARPVKVQPAMAAYREAEERLERVIAAKFGLVFPWPAAVKRADDAVLRAEARDLLPNSCGWWREGGDPAPVVVHPWSPAEAERMFLAEYASIVRVLGKEAV